LVLRVYHVHAKDTWINGRAAATRSRLENGPLDKVSDRAWSYITLGFGKSQEWWKEFVYRLSLLGYERARRYCVLAAGRSGAVCRRAQEGRPFGASRLRPAGNLNACRAVMRSCGACLSVGHAYEALQGRGSAHRPRTKFGIAPAWVMERTNVRDLGSPAGHIGQECHLVAFLQRVNHRKRQANLAE
jgi:hypothetical protein